MQFNYSVTTREAEKRLLPLCADKGVAVLVNRAFEDGNLFTQVQGRALPAWAAEFGAQSWAQVFLKFVLAHPAVTCVIPATGKTPQPGRQSGRRHGRTARREAARADHRRVQVTAAQASMAEISSSIARMTWAPLARIASKVLPGA